MKDLIATIVGIVVVTALLVTFIIGSGSGTVQGQTTRIGNTMITELGKINP